MMLPIFLLTFPPVGSRPLYHESIDQVFQSPATFYLPEAGTQTATDHPVWGNPDSSPRDGMISGQISRTTFD